VFRRVLIANRGEIAVRIARTLRRLGVESVAVHGDADAAAPHVRAADLALRLGPGEGAAPYLDLELIVAAARRAGAEAVHPGYGFLAESPELARACAAAGLAFVGPGPEAMALLGDKAAAKRAAEAAGVPVLPGLAGERLSDAEIEAWAREAEPPLVLKAVGAGGGRGMRVVRSPEELPEAIAAARREARAASGDERLLVERYLERARHIEVQVIADAHGTVLHLGERECSLQRRHQKVVEEAPSPVVDSELRARLGEAATALAREAGYVNAGTVELLAERDDPSRFYFLEMNARLQVEHPVTEAVTGLDLVELQLRVASGEPLPLRQEDVAPRGHAIEARVYAEDPARGFLPSTGRVVAYREPVGARVDSGVEQGTEVGTGFDPLLAKVVAHGADRAAALARLRAALAELVLLGPDTNVAYLRALLERPEVRAGELDTGLLERLGAEVAPPPPGPELPALALALLVGCLDEGRAAGDPWEARDAWRPAGPGTVRAMLEGPEGEVEVAIRPLGEGEWEWEAGGERGRSRFAPEPAPGPPGEALVAVGSDGAARRVRVLRSPDGPGAVHLLDGAAPPLRWALADEGRAGGGGAAAGSLEAPMPGKVIAVRCAPGEAVAEGQVLVVIESMKMELAVQSPAAGAVEAVLVGEGEAVERGQALVELSAAPAEAAA